MILSDRDIKARIAAGDIVVTSPNNDHEQNIHASSMDFRLGKHFKVYKKNNIPMLDPLKMQSFDNLTKLYTIEEPDQPFVIHPGDFVLGVTLEKIKIPNDLVARAEGRSSLGRLGIIIHSTAGFIDAGFEGTITLEITNINNVPVALYPGMRIGQFAFETMSSPAEVPYAMKASSKYQGQELPEASRITIDPEFQKSLRATA